MTPKKCSYLIFFISSISVLSVESIANPWESRDITGLYQSQSELMHRRSRNITNPILLRLEKIWLTRRSATSENVTQRIIETIHEPSNTPKSGSPDSIAKYEYQFLSSMTRHLYSILENSLWSNNWVIWSSGSVDIGKTGVTSQTEQMDHQTDGLTIGVEGRWGNDNLLGVVVNAGEDKTGVGLSGSRMATNDLGLAAYASLSIVNNYHMDIVYGLNKFGSNTHRNLGDSILKGKRHSLLIYLAINIGKDVRYSNLSFKPYSKIFIGYANLEPYSETGSPKALVFSEQHLHLLKYHLGAVVDYQLVTSFGRFRPFARVEHGIDFSQSSGVHSSYATLEGGLYHTKLHHMRASHWRFSLGMDFNFYDGWITTSYDRWEESEMHLDNQPMRESDTLNLELLLLF